MRKTRRGEAAGKWKRLCTDYKQRRSLSLRPALPRRDKGLLLSDLGIFRERPEIWLLMWNRLVFKYWQLFLFFFSPPTLWDNLVQAKQNTSVCGPAAACNHHFTTLGFNFAPSKTICGGLPGCGKVMWFLPLILEVVSWSHKRPAGNETKWKFQRWIPSNWWNPKNWPAKKELI